MGWRKVMELETSGEVDEASLWTRGGLEGVCVGIGEVFDNHIHIPRAAILRLVADEIRSARIAEWEQKNSSQVFESLGVTGFQFRHLD